MIIVAEGNLRENFELACPRLHDGQAAQAYWHLTDMQAYPPDVRYWLPAQPVDATQALNLSAGVSNCKVLRGRSLS
jgi:hypothetical protein